MYDTLTRSRESDNNNTTIPTSRPSTLRFNFISPGSFAVISGEIDSTINSTTTIQLPTKLIKRYREHSFSIIAEPNNSHNNSRSNSPISGRVSPFRGKGFRASSSTESLNKSNQDFRSYKSSKSRIPKLVKSPSNSFDRSSSLNNILNVVDSEDNLDSSKNRNWNNKSILKKPNLSPVQGTPPSKKSSASTQSASGTQIPKFTNRNRKPIRPQNANNNFIEQYFEQNSKVPNAITVNKFKKKHDHINNYKKHDVKVVPKGKKLESSNSINKNNNKNDEAKTDKENESNLEKDETDKSNDERSNVISVNKVVQDNKIEPNNKPEKNEDDQNRNQKIEISQNDIEKKADEEVNNIISLAASTIVPAVTETVAKPLEIETPIEITEILIQNEPEIKEIDQNISLPKPNEEVIENLMSKNHKTYPPTLENVEIKVINGNLTENDDKKLVQNEPQTVNDNTPKNQLIVESHKQSSSETSSNNIRFDNKTVINNYKEQNDILEKVQDRLEITQDHQKAIQSPHLNINSSISDNISTSKEYINESLDEIKSQNPYSIETKKLSKYSRIWHRINELIRKHWKRKMPKMNIRKRKVGKNSENGDGKKTREWKKIFSFVNWKKKRQRDTNQNQLIENKSIDNRRDNNKKEDLHMSSLAVEKEEKPVKKRFWSRIFPRTNKVTDVDKKISPKPVVNIDKSRIPKIKRKKPIGERCGNFFRIIFCLNFCRRKKLSKASSETLTRSSQLSTKKSQSLTVSKEEKRTPVDISFVEHNSNMHGAIPVLPMYLACFCLFFNILVPGLGTLLMHFIMVLNLIGTILSGIFCLITGKPRFKQQDDLKERTKSFFINTIVGFSQFFTIIFCFVGWGWSIWWGVIMFKLARKQKKLNLIRNEEQREDRSLPFTSSSFTDVERG